MHSYSSSVLWYVFNNSRHPPRFNITTLALSSTTSSSPPPPQRHTLCSGWSSSRWALRLPSRLDPWSGSHNHCYYLYYYYYWSVGAPRIAVRAAWRYSRHRHPGDRSAPNIWVSAAPSLGPREAFLRDSDRSDTITFAGILVDCVQCPGISRALWLDHWKERNVWYVFR